MEMFSISMNLTMRDAYHKMLVKVLDHQFTALTIGVLSLVATVVFDIHHHRPILFPMKMLVSL